MKRFNTKFAVIGFLAVLVVFFAVFGYFDWVVNSWVNNPYVDSPERDSWNQTYWTTLSVAMLMIGVSGAIFVKLVLPNRKVGTTLSIAILFSTVVMILGNLEDWLYYLLGPHSIPPFDSQMDWLFQSQTVSYWFGFNGSWTVFNTLVWSVVWLLIILPVGLVVIFKVRKN
jgi:hypothetical protein